MSTDLQQFQIHLEAVKKLYFAHFDMEPFDDDIEAFKRFVSGNPIRFYEMYRYFYNKEPQGYEVADMKEGFDAWVEFLTKPPTDDPFDLTFDYRASSPNINWGSSRTNSQSDRSATPISQDLDSNIDFELESTQSTLKPEVPAKQENKAQSAKVEDSKPENKTTTAKVENVKPGEKAEVSKSKMITATDTTISSEANLINLANQIGKVGLAN